MTVLRFLRSCLMLAVLSSTAAAQQSPPAKQQAAEDADLAAKFAAWKATLPEEQQAWETKLEQNLGSFYLPLYQREKLRGDASAWDYVQDNPELPRVLLIGDSISRGYTLATRRELSGRANVHRAPENCGSTANGLKKLDIWLDDGKWDLIHFNFGIHDRNTAPDVYEKNLEQVVDRLEKTGAKLIWANTTPVPPDTKDGSRMPAAIDERNAIAARVMQKHHIVIDDLFGWIARDTARYQTPQDVHFSSAGYDRLARRVARVIETALPAAGRTNTAIAPAGQLEVDSYDWEARHAAVMAVKDSLKPEIVLIGDSITHFWGGQPDGGPAGNRGTKAWQSLFGTRPVLNLGFGWDRTQNVLRRIELGELDGIAPKAIVIHIGTNNLAGTPQSRANTAEEIAEAIKVVVQQVQAKCPQAQIVLMSIFPRGAGATNPERQTIAEINTRTAGLAQLPRLTLLDITHNWLRPDGSVNPDLMPDLLHPNEAGYSVWAEALRPVLPR